jgi:hypothetical protein
LTVSNGCPCHKLQRDKGSKWWEKCSQEWYWLIDGGDMRGGRELTV